MSVWILNDILPLFLGLWYGVFLLFQAAEYFRMRLTHIPVNPETGKVDIGKMRRAINKNTCLVRMLFVENYMFQYWNVNV